MTVITIESNSEERTHFLIEYAEKFGLPVKTDEHRVLTTKDVALGIGRKATDKELTEYLLKNQSDKRIDIDTVFSKFED